MTRDNLSFDSLIEATRSRAKFSGHGSAKGAAGYRDESDGGEGEFLKTPGETAIINPIEEGYHHIFIGAAWDNLDLSTPPKNFIESMKRKLKPPKQGIDLDLGCLYELKNGKRGAIQAFGNLHGCYTNAPFIELSQDERTGDTDGNDEYILINGKHWPDFQRVLIYVYIYDGAPDWSMIKPQIQILVPGEQPMIVKPSVHQTELAVCAIGGIENVRNGIKFTNYTEYFPGHAEMDRAFGFGLEWTDGQKCLVQS